MVCREIINCPFVQHLRGEFQLCRIIYCETSSEPCALRGLLDDEKTQGDTLPNPEAHRQVPSS